MEPESSLNDPLWERDVAPDALGVGAACCDTLFIPGAETDIPAVERCAIKCILPQDVGHGNERLNQQRRRAYSHQCLRVVVGALKVLTALDFVGVPFAALCGWMPWSTAFWVTYLAWLVIAFRLQVILACVTMGPTWTLRDMGDVMQRWRSTRATFLGIPLPVSSACFAVALNMPAAAASWATARIVGQSFACWTPSDPKAQLWSKGWSRLPVVGHAIGQLGFPMLSALVTVVGLAMSTFLVMHHLRQGHVDEIHTADLRSAGDAGNLLAFSDVAHWYSAAGRDGAWASARLITGQTGTGSLLGRLCDASPRLAGCVRDIAYYDRSARFKAQTAMKVVQLYLKISWLMLVLADDGGGGSGDDGRSARFGEFFRQVFFGSDEREIELRSVLLAITLALYTVGMHLYSQWHLVLALRGFCAAFDSCDDSILSETQRQTLHAVGFKKKARCCILRECSVFLCVSAFAGVCVARLIGALICRGEFGIFTMCTV